MNMLIDGKGRKEVRVLNQYNTVTSSMNQYYLQDFSRKEAQTAETGTKTTQGKQAKGTSTNSKTVEYQRAGRRTILPVNPRYQYVPVPK